MRNCTFCNSLISVALLFPTSVVVQAKDHNSNKQNAQNVIDQNNKNPGRQSKRLPDVVLPESLGPSKFILERIQAGERPARPELPEVAVRPERPERPERPQKPERPQRPEIPDKPDKPGRPNVGRR